MFGLLWPPAGPRDPPEESTWAGLRARGPPPGRHPPFRPGQGDHLSVAATASTAMLTDRPPW